MMDSIFQGLATHVTHEILNKHRSTAGWIVGLAIKKASASNMRWPVGRRQRPDTRRRRRKGHTRKVARED
jgi:hypothetical protein